ncbi:MAG: NAD(P)H-dependent oxidoreductase [Bacillota bacterium]
MLIIGLNGSPRTESNTAIMVTKSLEVAAALGAETRLVNVAEVLTPIGKHLPQPWQSGWSKWPKPQLPCGGGFK